MPTASSEIRGLTRRERALCDAAIRNGSKSFHAASCLLPPAMRCAARALYAFCRASDDLIDTPGGGRGRATILRRRLDVIYSGRTPESPEDAAFAAVARGYAIPRAIPEALIEGFEWDEAGRRYETLDDLLAYAARVAGTVGVMMCLIMNRRDPATLARAADLGLAMQLTNIARDIGEDARNGRIYIPLAWLGEHGVSPRTLLEMRAASEPVRRMTRDLLAEAESYYMRAWSGIGALPASARPAIASAALIYREIGRAIEANRFDTVTTRAHTGTTRKLALIAKATGAIQLVGPLDCHPPDRSTAYLVNAAGDTRQFAGAAPKVERFIDLLHRSALRRYEMAGT